MGDFLAGIDAAVIGTSPMDGAAIDGAVINGAVIPAVAIATVATDALATEADVLDDQRTRRARNVASG